MSSFRQSLDDGSTVPPAAARWIVRTTLNKPNPHYWEQALTRTGGLRSLTAKELKAICAALETTQANRRRPPRERLRSYKNAKKKGLAAMIRACLYVDAPACEVEDAAALRELAARTTTNNAGAGGAAATAAASATNTTAAAAALPNNIPAAASGSSTLCVPPDNEATTSEQQPWQFQTESRTGLFAKPICASLEAQQHVFLSRLPLSFRTGCHGCCSGRPTRTFRSGNHPAKPRHNPRLSATAGHAVFRPARKRPPGLPRTVGQKSPTKNENNAAATSPLKLELIQLLQLGKKRPASGTAPRCPKCTRACTSSSTRSVACR